MTIRNYITQKFSSFGVMLKEADLVELWLSHNINFDMEITRDNIRDVEVAIAGMTPRILAMPDVSEGGMSISMDREALKEYHSLLCRELGIDNKLTKPKPKIRFI